MARSTHPEYRLACGTETANRLVDAWAAAGNPEEADSFPCEGRIDHVFITRDLVPTVKKAWIGSGVEASDHWPVFVDFEL